MIYGEYKNAFKGISQTILEPINTIEFNTPMEAIKAAFKTMDINIITMDISKVKEGK